VPIPSIHENIPHTVVGSHVVMYNDVPLITIRIQAIIKIIQTVSIHAVYAVIQDHVHRVQPWHQQHFVIVARKAIRFVARIIDQKAYLVVKSVVSY
jgi:hypothetical protein